MSLKQDAELVTEIDADSLDLECIKLPSNYRQFAFLAAEAKQDVQEAKAFLEVVQAELSRDIRGRPGFYGLDKVTEAALNSLVIIQERYQNSQAALFKAQHRSEMCSAVVWALEHKKRSLTSLVELHGMGYFAEVKVNREGKEAIQKMVRKRSIIKTEQKTTE